MRSLPFFLGTLTLALLAGRDARAQVDEPLFPTPVFRLPANHNATYLACADLDGDRRPDLVTSSGAFGSTLALLRGGGPSSFVSDVRLDATGQPMDLAFADFDRDGKLDVVCGHNAQAMVNVFFGDGAGGATSRLDLATPQFSIGVGTGDLNHDGNPDLVYAPISPGSARVRLGDGLGGFGAETSFAIGGAGGPKTTVIVAELTGDAHLDVLVSRGNGRCFLLAGDGTGQLGTPAALPGSDSAFDAQAADFDHDGDLDVAVLLFQSSFVAVYPNLGGGAWGPITLLSIPSQSYELLATDLDGDGAIDVAASCKDLGLVATWHGDGTGGFSRFELVPGGANPYGMAAGDWNGDGRSDLAVGEEIYPGFVVNLGDAAGRVGGRSYFTGAAPSAIASADLDHDGRAELVVADQGSDDVAILRGRADGDFEPAIVLAVPDRPIASALGDLDHDGDVDLAVLHATGPIVSVWRGDGTGGMTSAGSVSAPADPRGIVLADFDGDAVLDLAVAGSGTSGVEVRLGDGSGAFGAATFTSTGAAPSALVATDLDGDGAIDLATANQSSGSLSILRGLGDGTFAALPSVPSASGAARLAASDVDLDGILDLVVGANFGSGRVVWHRGLGAGTYGPQIVLLSNLGTVQDVAVADFDDDDVPDVAALEFGFEYVNVLRATAPGSFASAERYGTFGNPVALATVDVDLDGRVDLVVASNAAGSVHVLPRYRRDCNGDGVADPQQIASGALSDCNLNGIPDGCDLAIASSADTDGDSVPDECEAIAGTTTCAGDGSAASCPCGNSSPAGSGAGCLHSFGVGARLSATGEARTGADSLVLHLDDTPPSTIALYLQGTDAIGGGQGTPFGDGLFCLEGAIVRLGARTSVAGSSTSPAPGTTSLSVRGFVPHAGGTRHYQAWFRNNASFCTSAAFNTSNGLTIVWTP